MCFPPRFACFLHSEHLNLLLESFPRVIQAPLAFRGPTSEVPTFSSMRCVVQSLLFRLWRYRRASQYNVMLFCAGSLFVLQLLLAVRHADPSPLHRSNNLFTASIHSSTFTSTWYVSVQTSLPRETSSISSFGPSPECPPRVHHLSTRLSSWVSCSAVFVELLEVFAMSLTTEKFLGMFPDFCYFFTFCFYSFMPAVCNHCATVTYCLRPGKILILLLRVYLVLLRVLDTYKSGLNVLTRPCVVLCRKEAKVAQDPAKGEASLLQEKWSGQKQPLRSPQRARY